MYTLAYMIAILEPKFAKMAQKAVDGITGPKY